MKQLNDEQRIRSMKQEAENGLVIGDEIGMRDALEQILREADEHLGITGEAQPAEQANGLEAVAKLAASQEALPAEMSTVLASIDYTTPPAQPARE